MMTKRKRISNSITHCVTGIIGLGLCFFALSGWAAAVDYTSFDITVNSPLINDGVTTNGWTNANEGFWYTDGSNNQAKATWTFAPCIRPGKYRILVKIPYSTRGHAEKSVSYEIYRNGALLLTCPLNQSSYYGYASLGNGVNTDYLFTLSQGDEVRIQFTTNQPNVGVEGAKLFYMQDYDLGITRYEQVDDRWRCKTLYGASSESDTPCSGDETWDSYCSYHPENGTGPMGCWGCLTCAFTSAVSYYGVHSVEIHGEIRNLNPRRLAAIIDEADGYQTDHNMWWAAGSRAIEGLKDGIDVRGPTNYSLNSGGHKYIIEDNLKKGFPVIVETRYPGGGEHWVLVKGIRIVGDQEITYYICDSEIFDTGTDLRRFNNYVARYLVITGPIGMDKSWFFNKDNLEGWSVEGCSAHSVNARGWLELTPEYDPQLISAYLSIEISPEDPNEGIELIQFFGRNNSQDSTGEIFIKTDVNGRYSPNDSLFFSFPNDNSWHLIQINVHDISGWDEANRINGIRIDPIKTVTAGADEKIYIDFIRLRARKLLSNVADESVRWHPDGAFLKSANSSSVYLIERGFKRPIPDGSTFEAFNYDWTNVITVNEAELDCYPTGAPLPLPMSLERVIKRAGVDANGKPYPKVYLVKGDDEIRRWIRSDKVAEDLGIDLLTGVEEVSESELNSYNDGPDVTTIYPEGTLVKEPNSPGIYIVSNGEARLFSSQDAFEKLGYYAADDDEDGLWDSVVEIKELPQNTSAHTIDSSLIYECGGTGNCLVNMTWPLGGEVLTGGTARETKYTLPNPENCSNVVITSTLDGYVSEEIITTNAPKNSSYTWNIPDVFTEEASVRITAYDFGGRPYSASPETYVTIESNTAPGQDYFDIYNDGGVDLRVTSITLENNSAWVILNNNNPLPPGSGALTVGPNSSLRIPVSVDKSDLPVGLHSDVIHVASDDPDNPDSTIEIHLSVNSEYVAPSPPVNLNVSPSGWSQSQTYTVDWTNPADPSGIAGGYYKFASEPVNNTDGIYFDISQKPLQIHAYSGGSYTVYVWLKDSLGNVDFQNYASVSLFHDATPPYLQDLSPSENATNIPVHTPISALVKDEFSGVDRDNIIMEVNGGPVVPQQINDVGDAVMIQYQPAVMFGFDELVDVYVKISDTSDPANFVEKTYSFRTFASDGDADGDGLPNSQEYQEGTDALNSDSDGDGMADGWEVNHGLDPTSGEGINGPDGDVGGDGLTNLQEYLDGMYYAADPAEILDAPTGTVTSTSATIHIGGNGVVAYQYKLDGGTWQPEVPISTAIELAGLSNGLHTLYVIGKDQSGYWQSEGSASTASWTVAPEATRYTLSNGHISLSGINGYIDQLYFDPSGGGNYGQNIINENGQLDWLIDGVTFSNENTTIQIQEPNRIVLNNQGGALWDINLNGTQFSSSLNLVYTPGNVQLRMDMPYEDSGYYDYAQRYHWQLGNNHDALEIPFKTFYSQTGNTRTIEYFMRNQDTGHYMQFRTNLLDDTQHEPTAGSNRLVAMGTGNFDIDFNNLPSHQIWVEKTSDTLTICSGQDTNAQTVNFDFQVTQFDEYEDIDANEYGDKMPYFYTSSNETITNVYGGEYTFDELLNHFYRQSAFYYTDVGLNIWWNWASQYTGFVNNWYRNKLKANLETWEQGDDGYGHSGYMWSWPGNREWPMGDLYLTYDFRLLNTNALFIQAAWNYYAWTGDNTFLSGQLQRLRDAMQYQLDWLGGSGEYIVNGDNAYDSDHGGIHNEDVGTNYWDIMPFGGKDAYCSIDFYKSLMAMSQMEYTLGNTSEGDSYSTLAEQARTAYNAAFWSTSTNRYVGAIDRLDNVHDYGFSFVNIEALAAGLGDSTKASQIYSWLDSGDIYSTWEFAPRTNVTTTQNQWRIPDNNGYVWEQQIQDGGANLYVSGYDVIARAKYIDADDAYARLKAILERYSEPDKLTGGSPTIFNETIQGGSDGAGSLGVMSHEFPESGIAGSSFLYAFIGLEPKRDALHIDPRVPSGQEYVGAKNIDYRGMNLNFHITHSTVRIECTKNENIGDSYYVIDGAQKQFPGGTFVIDEPMCESDYFVAPPPLGDDINNTGVTPDSPFATIQHAIDIAAASESCPVTIHAAAGTYSVNVVMDDWESLEGGWNSDFSQRWDFENDGIQPTMEFESVVDGGEVDRCILMNSLNDISINGFTIESGRADSGGGIYLTNCSLTMTNCSVTGNTATGETQVNGLGAGIYSTSSSLIISNSAFRSNEAVNAGGGIYVSGGEATIDDCIFAENIAGLSGGGNIAGLGGGGIKASSDTTDVSIKNCVFFTNEAKSGGAFFNMNCSFHISNTIFHGNNARWGGAIYNDTMLSSLSQAITNATFLGNHADNYGGALYNASLSSLPITNSILWGNTSPNGHEIYGISATVSYSDIQGCGRSGAGWDSSLGTDAGGNIDADPLFGADCHLQAGSLCINAGDPSSAPPLFPGDDIDGEDRPQGGRYDMGADEFLDSDGDNIPDYWEQEWFGNLNQNATTDWDDDGLTDLEEFQHGTNPKDADSDDDGVNDGLEVTAGTDPNDPTSYPAAIIRLKKGFNLVAIAADVSTQSDLRDWLPTLGDSSEIEKVMVYDGQAGKFITLIPGDPSNPSFILQGGEGLIVYAKQDKEIAFESVLCSTLDLKQGFNLIGIACPQEGYSAFQLLNDLGSGNVSSIQRYSTEKGAFETAGFGPDGQRVVVDFPIVPGEGYFVYMLHEGSKL